MTADPSEGVRLAGGRRQSGRTQGGNNNAYCQDNEISWFNWEHEPWQKDSPIATSKRSRPAGSIRFSTSVLICGRRNPTSGTKDLLWFGTDGSEMTGDDWSGYHRCLGMMLSGDALDVRDANGEAIRDDAFLMIFNAHDQPVKFVLAGKEGVEWSVAFDTRYESGRAESAVTATAGDEFEVDGRSMCLLHLARGSQEDTARNGLVEAPPNRRSPRRLPEQPRSASRTNRSIPRHWGRDAASIWRKVTPKNFNIDARRGGSARAKYQEVRCAGAP